MKLRVNIYELLLKKLDILKGLGDWNLSPSNYDVWRFEPSGDYLPLFLQRQ